MSPTDPILARLLDLHPKKIDLALDRMHRLLAALGDPQRRLPAVIHVAGTNGKGSTVAFMRATLEAAGLGVHVYTSPHLVRFNERIRLADRAGGRLVSDAVLSAAFDAVETANAGAPITFFEATTAAAFKLFSEHPADVLLLEVGLGGRLDATNVIDAPACAVITPISRDHVEFLGDSLEAIAREKAGILKRGAPAVFSAQDAAAQAALEQEAARLGVRPRIFGQDYLSRREGGRLIYEDASGLLDLPLPRLPGAHQTVNAGAALAAVRAVFPDLAPQAFEQGMTRAEWPARLQNLGGGRLAGLLPRGAEIWLDGGHNEAGAKALAQAMAERAAVLPLPLVLIYGALKTKSPEAFLRQFAGLAAQVLVVPLHGDQASWPPEEIVAVAGRIGLAARTEPDAVGALRSLARDERAPPLRVLIAGSLYLSGDVLAANATPPV
ncbi:dihydrofolate synthase / folylpolyglutamate synthase [Rhodoblastus acidophilus]|uniref:tetrahydrofolate synthase n=1 Tax=Rhodoblastus acidophilus TaxID=1074 RepID=A0A212RLG7_RHOAC|nr:folylpolyglutamate synthase/dihydrofolate synthase family protein [Rhodoblastus acidophilus]PPQ39089.1 bifunctional folylpolyglutamate synthase/dihydrofolate synthase [Rhodoblastus acidophilus]RAI24201.1 bifunctional folylpolyglutamate synthase/dihydrofolate synthase [Rhodoblastus acidophilus]SNB73291.1 dihydrofolate synthase / folylpolyglutamate synthase [Rhodoblastus acidophilus]